MCRCQKWFLTLDVIMRRQRERERCWVLVVADTLPAKPRRHLHVISVEWRVGDSRRRLFVCLTVPRYIESLAHTHSIKV